MVVFWRIAMTTAKRLIRSFKDGFLSVFDLGPMPELRPIPYVRKPFPSDEAAYALALEQVAQAFRQVLPSPQATQLLNTPAP